MEINKAIESLVKALEAGQYNSAPGNLTQGSALQIEDLSPIMQNVTFAEKEIKLQKLFSTKKAKGTLTQFNRQLSYGRFGGSAQIEGAVGDVDVGDYVRVTVPMAFYSHIRRVSLVANLVETVDGVKAEDREGDNAAIKIAADIEFDLFKGKADFSNNGVFDGNPLDMPMMPNMLGIDAQVRQSDILANTQDLMFAAYGSSQSVVLNAAGNMDQSFIEDVALRSRLNFGAAENLYLDPTALANYNKRIALGTGANSIQRVVLGGSAQDASGASLRRQWVSDGAVTFESSNFLRGKVYYPRPTIGSAIAPTLGAITTPASCTTLAAGDLHYTVTAENARGEGFGVASGAVTLVAGDSVSITINNVAGALCFNVYRGPTAANQKFIGRVKNSGASTTIFIDLNNRLPGSVTGYFLEAATWGIHELQSYSRLKLAISDLSIPEAHFRFCSVAGYMPRKNVLCDGII
jgi:hypothetical protein